MKNNNPDSPIAHGTKTMNRRKTIALIAHDHRKEALIDWCEFNQGSLTEHNLYGTGSSGKMLPERGGLGINSFCSCPLGGDLEIGGAISPHEIHMMIFLWVPLRTPPHDVD